MSIRLALPEEPFELDLAHGVRMRVRPMTTALYYTARTRALKRLGELRAYQAEVVKAGGAISGIPDMAEQEVAEGYLEMLIAQELGKIAIVSWDGVLDEEGAPAEVTAPNVERCLSVIGVGERFMTLYAAHLDKVLAEGKPSPRSPTGITAGAGPIAKDAGPSPAARKKKAKTRAAQKTGAAPLAPTGNARPRSKGRRSGKS